MRRFAIVILVVSATAARAEVTRYDLGQRLRLMDRAWESATPANRAMAVAPLKKVVPYFLANKNSEAAAVLDEARFILRGIAEPSPAERWATSLFVDPAVRLLDLKDGPLTVRVSASYAVDGRAPENARLRLTASPRSKLLELLDERIVQIPARYSLPIEKFPAGDHVVIADVVVDGKTLATGEFMVSIVPGFQGRLEAARKAIRGLDPMAGNRPAGDTESARSLLELLNGIALGRSPETNYPAARLLDEIEAIRIAAAGDRLYYGPDRPGQFWLAIPDRHSGIRLFVPAGLQKGRPVPLIVVMHGLGASENMFFDAYGDGAAVKMCKERGWLLVATRAGGLLDPAPPVGRIVDELSQRYPVDPKRVYILGHSMGAAQTIATVQAHPGKFAAAAALGGGGAVRRPDAVKGLPVFVACGREDFALSGARDLAKALERAGAKVTFKEYPAIEHIVIVQAAMMEMFRFFEGAGK